MLRPPHNVNRVIARPFVGKPGAFRRTPNRRDYAIEPPPNLLDELRTGYDRGARGRKDLRHLLWAGSHLVGSRDRQSRCDGEERSSCWKTSSTASSSRISTTSIRSTVIAATYAAMARRLKNSIAMLPGVEARLRPGDEVIFTADHGCDPTAPGTDHTREYVPFIHLGPAAGGALGDLEGLDFVGRTVKEALLG